MSSQTVISPNGPALEAGPSHAEVRMISTREMMFGWLSIKDKGTAAVGRIADASFVFVVFVLASLVTIVGILDARKAALSLVRITWIEEEMCCTSDGSRGMYRGWIKDILTGL